MTMEIDDLLSSISKKLDETNTYDSMKEIVEKTKKGIDKLLKKKMKELGIYLIKISYDQYNEGQYDLSPWEHIKEKKTFMNLQDLFSDIEYEYGLDARDLLTNTMMLNYAREKFEMINKKGKNKKFKIADYGDTNVNILTTMKHLGHILSPKHTKSCADCKLALLNFIQEIEKFGYYEAISLETFFKVIEKLKTEEDDVENFRISIIE